MLNWLLMEGEKDHFIKNIILPVVSKQSYSNFTVYSLLICKSKNLLLDFFFKKKSPFLKKMGLYLFWT